VTGRREQLAAVGQDEMHIWWPAGASMLPASSTGLASLVPSAAAVHTSMPGLMSTTRTSPPGVEIRVEAARQIGQGGAPVGARELTVTTPSTRTVPVTMRYDAAPPFDRTR
jgi:hypothetical protein